MDDPFEPFNKLQGAVDRVARTHGVRVRSFAVANERREINIVFEITDEAFLTDDQKMMDAQFRQIEEQERLRERDEKIRLGTEETKRKLAQMAREQGLFGDDNGPTEAPQAGDEDSPPDVRGGSE